MRKQTLPEKRRRLTTITPSYTDTPREPLKDPGPLPCSEHLTTSMSARVSKSTEPAPNACFRLLPRPPRSGANQHPPFAGSAPIIHRAGPSPTTFAGALSLNSGAWLGWRDGILEDGGAFPARGFPGEGLRLAGAGSGPGEAEAREDPGL